MSNGSDISGRWTIGVDLGDKDCQYYALDGTGDAVEQGRLKTTQAGFRRRFEKMKPASVIVETGTHAPWVAELDSRKVAQYYRQYMDEHVKQNASLSLW